VSAEPTAVSQQDIETAKASFQRCCRVEDDFFPSFYRTFFINCPQVEPLFAGTDFQRQHKLLKHAIGLLLIFPNQSTSEPTILTRVAERHSRRDLDIDPSLYPAFVDSLMQTVQQHDQEFTPDVERAWRVTMASGIEYMQSLY
jgi:hemoglobin-like flavoprotein